MLAGASFDTTCRQGLDTLDHLPETFRFRAGHAEQVGEEISRLASGLGESVEEPRVGLRVVTGSGQREQADLVRLDLIFPLMIVATAKNFGFARGVFDQTVVLL